MLDDFPSCTWTQPPSWWRQQTRCFDDLAIETAAADPEPRCTGEEMALHLIVRRAREMATAPTDQRPDLTDSIPAHPRDDDWSSPFNFLFQDHDVLTLFDHDYGTFSRSDLVEGQSQLRTVNLAPTDWFTPFADAPDRDKARGFRR